MKYLFVMFMLLTLALSVQAQTSHLKPTILITWYSVTGHTEEMAQAVAQGASSVPGVQVQALPVDSVREPMLLRAQAIIVGSPVYNGNVAPAVQQFINNWPFDGQPMKDKIGAAFVSAGGFSAGEELVQLNILHSMLIFNMIVVGGPDWKTAFGASTVVEEAGTGKPEDSKKYFLAKGRRLGKRVAQLTLECYNNKMEIR